MDSCAALPPPILTLSRYYDIVAAAARAGDIDEERLEAAMPLHGLEGSLA